MYRSGGLGPDETGSVTGPVKELVPIYHSSGDLITIPDAHLLFCGSFKRAGNDLILTGDGKKVVVHDYFAHDQLSALQSPEGAALPGKLVATLAGPEHPGQYALAQSDHVPAADTAGKHAIARIETVSGSVTIEHADGLVVQANVGDQVYQG